MPKHLIGIPRDKCKRAYVRFSYTKNLVGYTYHISTYLVQLQALFVHVLLRLKFPQQQFYHRCIKKAELC